MIQKPSLPCLTGLRAVAAYMVFIAHATGAYWIYPSPWTISPLAYCGMALFFVLSGFVITYNYSGYFLRLPYRKALKIFLVARFARLYPLYALFLFGCLPFLLNYSIFLYATMTQTWANEFARTFSQAWSISAEWLFYLIFLALIPLLNRITRLKTIIATTLAIWLGNYGYLYLLLRKQATIIQKWFSTVTVASGPDVVFWFQYFSPYMHITSFFMGCLTAKCIMALMDKPISTKEREIGRIMTAGSCALIVLTLSINIFSSFESSYLQMLSKHYIYAPAIALYIFSIVRYGGVGYRLLNAAPMLLLGEMSYSIYLLQHWVFDAFPQKNLLNIPISMVMTTLFAYGTYALWEVPTRKWIRAQFLS